MRPVIALVFIGTIAGCASGATAPSVAAPEPAPEARLYDLGSTELLHAGFGGDARGSGTFFVSLPDGEVLWGNTEPSLRAMGRSGARSSMCGLVSTPPRKSLMAC